MRKFPETMDEVRRDNLKTLQAEREAAEFDAKMEKHFQSHPEVKHGRDYRMQVFHVISRKERNKYRENFDKIFPDAPGAGL